MEITRNGPAPIAEDGVKRISELYRIEAALRCLEPQVRLARRQRRSAPLVADIQACLLTFSVEVFAVAHWPQCRHALSDLMRT